MKLKNEATMKLTRESIIIEETETFVEPGHTDRTS